MVYRKGKLFEVGVYKIPELPTGQFSMSAEELKRAVDTFVPVDIDLDHHKTVLDGKLGRITTVELSEDGRVLFGTHERPRWLDEVLGAEPCPVSCTWDTETKSLHRVALTNTPRITDAALFSAYAAFSGVTIDPTSQKQEKKKMSIFDQLKALFSEATPEELAEVGFANFATDPPPTDPPTTSVPTTSQPPHPAPPPKKEAEFSDPRVAALEAEITKMRQEREVERSTQRTERATSKVDALIKSGHLLPADRARSIATFSRAMQDDEKDPTLVEFSDAAGAKFRATRTDSLEAHLLSMPAHNLTQEQLVAFALPTQQSSGEQTADQKKARLNDLIDITPMGHAHIEAQKNGGRN